MDSLDSALAPLTRDQYLVLVRIHLVGLFFALALGFVLGVLSGLASAQSFGLLQ